MSQSRLDVGSIRRNCIISVLLREILFFLHLKGQILYGIHKIHILNFLLLQLDVSGPVKVHWKGSAILPLCCLLSTHASISSWAHVPPLSNKRTINRTPFSLYLNCRDHALKSSEEAEDTGRCLKMSSALPRATKTERPKNNNKVASDRFVLLLAVFFFFLALTQMPFLLKLALQMIC